MVNVEEVLLIVLVFVDNACCARCCRHAEYG